MDSVAESSWAPTQFYTSKRPSLATRLDLEPDPSFPENFVRTAKWCSDGSSVLAHCENRTFQLLNMQASPVSGEILGNSASSHGEVASLRTFRQPSPILDFIWYPAATPSNPLLYCFVASVRETPVKLLDASDGRLRASYRIVDHRERQVAPHSLAFNLAADKLYCGFEDAIEVFDVSYPGEGIRLPTTPSKKSKDGLKGIISALAFSPSQGSDFYAAGSLSPTLSNIAMFSEARGEPVMFVGGGPRASITQLHFNPTMPHILYAAYRRHEAIYSWDLRANVDAPIHIYRDSNTEGRTNQRIRFDIDSSGRWMSTGNQRGDIYMFDLHNDVANSTGEASPASDLRVVHPTMEFDAHNDAIGSVAFHPLRSTLISASGSRHFHPEDDDNIHSETSSDSDESGEDDDGTGARETSNVIKRLSRPHPVTLDSSIKLWNFEPEIQIQP